MSLKYKTVAKSCCIRTTGIFKHLTYQLRNTLSAPIIKIFESFLLCAQLNKINTTLPWNKSAEDVLELVLVSSPSSGMVFVRSCSWHDRSKSKYLLFAILVSPVRNSRLLLNTNHYK